MQATSWGLFFLCFPQIIDLSHYNPSLIDLMLANISADCNEKKGTEDKPYLLYTQAYFMADSRRFRSLKPIINNY